MCALGVYARSSIDDLIARSDYELFKNVCSPCHSLYHLLPPCRILVICVRVVVLSSCLNMIQICIKNRSLFDLCMNLLKYMILVISDYHCFIAHCHVSATLSD